jgi:4-methyl-5(b-hydroxyethyl)-thiazole monophosphate biosynthesis
MVTAEGATAEGAAQERILVPLADGFEELEAVAIVDILRRAQLDVTVGGLSERPRGRSEIVVEPDAPIGELDLDRFTMVVLPGGLGGTEAMMADERLIALVRRLHGEGRVTAAICAAPMVLAKAGVIEGVQVTAHPSVQGSLGGAVVSEAERVVRSGSVVTSQGPGTAVEFALALVEDLCGPETASELARAMCVAPPV